VRQENRRLAGARNTGITLARAPLVGFCDSDDVWHPRKGERQVALMDAAPDIGVTFSFSAYLDDAGAPTGQILTTRCLAPRSRDLVRRNHLGNGSTAIVRRTCLERVGMYDESLGNVEEWELWVRIAARLPDRIVGVPEPLTGYRVREGSLSRTYESFLANAWIAIQRFGGYVPGFTRRKAQRAYAEVLRIASRKSLAAGDVGRSRAFLVEALRRSPALLVSDRRALAMACAHVGCLVLPRAAQRLPYRLMERLLQRVQRGTLGPAVMDAWRFAGEST
jgi:glycosyltransferase involved in cell wall biosynthesis